MKCALIALTSCATVAVAAAQGMSDPTRPPAAGSALDAQAATAAPSSRLQSVVLSRGRRSALIDGAIVPLGGKVGEATLVHVADSYVVLDTNGTRETLKLIPQVEKTPAKRASAREREARAR